jgi:predicted transcriptional regulator of viral defense system
MASNDQIRLKNKDRLSAVLQRSGELVSADNVISALGMNRTQAVKQLSRWRKQGWLKRIGPGIYAPIPLNLSTSEQVLNDPWIIVPALYEPGYVGGWTAAEHWDLTDQIFNSIFVCTTQQLKKRNVVRQGVPFVLKHIRSKALFGIRTVWRGSVKVPISDKHKTIIDLLDDPSVGGGIRHVESCLENYLRSDDVSQEKLIEYAQKLGNGAVFKRLGFLASKLEGTGALVEACKKRLTAGNAKLDPAQPSPRLVKRWNLWIPQRWVETSKNHD